MALLPCIVQTGAIALASSAARTFQTLIVPADTQVAIRKIFIGVQGISATDTPITLEVIRASADFTGTPTANSPKNMNEASGITPRTTGNKWASGAVEPTYTTTLFRTEFHPQVGYVIDFGDAPLLVGKNGSVAYIGVRLTTNSAITYNASCTIEIEE